MGSYTKEFATTKSGTYSGLYGVRLTITNTFTASANKSKVKITKVEFKDPFTRNAPLYGKAYIGNTSTVVADYEGGSSQINTSAGSYVSCPAPSATEVEVQHDSSGEASITVGILKSSSLSGDFFGIRYSNGNWGVDTPKSATVTITEPAPYSISYNANGGSGAPSSQAVYATYSYSLSATSPTRTGYTFKGWATSSSATTAQYQPGASVTISGNLALYAVWQINTYAVDYDANGGSGAPASQTKTYGQTLVLAADVPTRTGYTFKGWATTSDASVAQYQPSGNYTANQAATLYAVWQINQYSLSVTKSEAGLVLNVTRTDSPIAGAATGILSDGTVIYYGDKLTVAYALSAGYAIDTATINGVDMSGTSEAVTVSDNVAVIVLVELQALAHIDNGASIEMYQIYIDDGNSFSAHQAYIDNGVSWDVY